MDDSVKRKLKIDMGDLVDAFDNSEDMLTYYLDLDTGEVILVTEEINSLLETIYHEYFHNQTEKLDWEAAYAAYRVPDWQRQELQEAHQVELGRDTRYIHIPTVDSHDSYQDMADFIETVKVKDLRSELKEAISGRGAFRRFKDELLNYPALRQAWFDFKQEKQLARALDWLDQEDIQLAGESDDTGD